MEDKSNIHNKQQIIWAGIHSKRIFFHGTFWEYLWSNVPFLIFWVFYENLIQIFRDSFLFGEVYMIFDFLRDLYGVLLEVFWDSFPFGVMSTHWISCSYDGRPSWQTTSYKTQCHCSIFLLFKDNFTFHTTIVNPLIAFFEMQWNHSYCHIHVQRSSNSLRVPVHYLFISYLHT